MFILHLDLAEGQRPVFIWIDCPSIWSDEPYSSRLFQSRGFFPSLPWPCRIPTTTLSPFRLRPGPKGKAFPAAPAPAPAALAMDFSEQDVDVFGEDYDVQDGGAEAEADGGGDSSGSSSPSSSSSSSAAASSSSSSGGSSRSSSDGAAGEGEDGADEGDAEEYDSSNLVGTRATGAGGYRDDERGEDGDEEVEEERDLFGSDNEDYVRTPARSQYLVPGPSFFSTKLGANALGPVSRLNSSSFCLWFQN